MRTEIRIYYVKKNFFQREEKNRNSAYESGEYVIVQSYFSLNMNCVTRQKSNNGNILSSSPNGVAEVYLVFNVNSIIME